MGWSHLEAALTWSLPWLLCAPIFPDRFRDWCQWEGRETPPWHQPQMSEFIIGEIFFSVTSTLWKDKKLKKLNANIKWQILMLTPHLREMR